MKNSENEIAVNMFKCHFLNFNVDFPSVTEILITPTTQVAMGAVDIHFNGFSTSRLNVVINGTTFENLQVPLFAPCHVMFNGSSNNSVLFLHTNFTNCVGKTGGAMLIDFKQEATNNKVTVSSSSFTDVSAFVEGAAISGNYLDSNKNTIILESCRFFAVFTAEVMLEEAVLFFYSNRRPPHGNRASSSYDVLLQNCQFGKDETNGGLVIAKSVRILYESSK
ncbi:uncharacterized protein LOC134194731 [Corticium candelabrum]|uniref:uncharacterized protein LOC134194731 n=1 Tax=Corticium candelabrum TaxID=121492 RepID=UPI002E25FA2B|nr:uncharacterized protein LOC134194731 [Corticium candelabrum]